jgi:hypothetical protein
MEVFASFEHFPDYLFFARRNTSKRFALGFFERRKLHFMGASLELNGA